MFKKESLTVKTWVTLVLNGTYKKEDVPQFFNLREVVYAVLDGVAQ